MKQADDPGSNKIFQRWRSRKSRPVQFFFD